MSSTIGIPDSVPTRYVGPDADLVPIKKFKRRPLTTDKKFPIGQQAIIGKNPTTGVQGELWYLSHFDSSGNAIWVLLSTETGNIVEVNVDTNTSPGTNPVESDTSGKITITGGQVEAGVVGANVIRTDSLDVNKFTIEVQRSASNASTDSAKNGVCHFNSSMFSVDDNGFVSISGGGSAIDQIAVDASSGLGTNPVIPTATGQITVTGAQVAAGVVGANVIRTDSLAANTYTLEIQRSTAVSSSADANNGVAHFSSTDFNVDANGFVTTTLSGSSTIGVKNIGISYSAGTFSITSASGSALSSSNIGYVTLQSKSTPGTLVTVSVTANQTFVDDSGVSTIGGNLFGFTATDTTTSNDVPFFLYAVLNDSENAISFMISRVPGMSTSAATIGKTGSSVADAPYDMFALDNPTVADYDSNPCLAIGSFRMRLTTAPGDWTVQTLAFTDGIGRFQENIRFELPTGVIGAASGSFFRANGGTAPQINAQKYYYTLDQSGRIVIQLGGTSVAVSGAGAVSLWLVLPFPSYYVEYQNLAGIGRWQTNATHVTYFMTFLHEDATGGYVEISRLNDTSTEVIMTNSEITIASVTNSILFQLIYNLKIS